MVPISSARITSTTTSVRTSTRISKRASTRTSARFGIARLGAAEIDLAGTRSVDNVGIEVGIEVLGMTESAKDEEEL
jgi:hypothetical protein